MFSVPRPTGGRTGTSGDGVSDRNFLRPDPRGALRRPTRAASRPGGLSSSRSVPAPGAIKRPRWRARGAEVLAGSRWIPCGAGQLRRSLPSGARVRVVVGRTSSNMAPAPRAAVSVSSHAFPVRQTNDRDSQPPCSTSPSGRCAGADLNRFSGKSHAKRSAVPRVDAPVGGLGSVVGVRARGRASRQAEFRPVPRVDGRGARRHAAATQPVCSRRPWPRGTNAFVRAPTGRSEPIHPPRIDEPSSDDAGAPTPSGASSWRFDSLQLSGAPPDNVRFHGLHRDVELVCDLLVGVASAR